MHLVVPSERNFEIYHAVETENLSRREAAVRFGISSTRVQQVVDQVKSFVSLHGDPALLMTSPERLELSSLHLCYEKLDYFYKSTMRMWQKVKEQPSACNGSIRLLQAAARLAVDQTKVVARIAKVRINMIEEGTLEQVDPAQLQLQFEEDAVEENTPATSPPGGGCTVPATTGDDELVTRILENIAMPAAMESCDQMLMAMQRRKLAQPHNTAPAQRRGKLRRSTA